MSDEKKWDGIERRSVSVTSVTTHGKGGLRFDPTINIAHVLTALAFIGAGVTAWSTLDKRVTVLEERAQTQVVTDRAQDALMTANMAAIREALSEIKQQIQRINDRQDRQQKGAH